MKKQIKSNLSISLQSVGIIFLIFFVMAFACGDSNEDDLTRTGDSSDKTTTSGGGNCSTAPEFKNLLIKHYSEIFNERDGKFRDTEVEFHTFKIGQAFRYRNSYPLIDANPAYPVETSHTKRDYLGETFNTRILEYNVKGKYIFYIDHHGDCVFASDGTKMSEGKHIPYSK